MINIRNIAFKTFLEFAHKAEYQVSQEIHLLLKK